MSSASSSTGVPLPMIIATLLLSCIGVIGNLLILLSTIFFKSLHTRCNLLIAILAGADVIACSYFVHLRILMFQQWYNVSNKDCFNLSVYGLLAMNIQSALCLILGFDRLLAVSLPIKYPKVSPFSYIIMLISGLIYAILITYSGFLDSQPDIIVAVCFPPTAYSTKARNIWIAASLVIAVLVIIVYGIAHIKCNALRASNPNARSVDRISHLLTSLTLVVAVYSATWFLTLVALVFTQTVNLPPSVAAQINLQLGWLVIINASVNVFIYFYRAPEYRRVFLRILSCGRYPRKIVFEYSGTIRGRSRSSPNTLSAALSSAA